MFSSFSFVLSYFRRLCVGELGGQTCDGTAHEALGRPSGVRISPLEPLQVKGIL